MKKFLDGTIFGDEVVVGTTFDADIEGVYDEDSVNRSLTLSALLHSDLPVSSVHCVCECVCACVHAHNILACVHICEPGQITTPSFNFTFCRFGDTPPSRRGSPTTCGSLGGRTSGESCSCAA